MCASACTACCLDGRNVMYDWQQQAVAVAVVVALLGMEARRCTRSRAFALLLPFLLLFLVLFLIVLLVVIDLALRLCLKNTNLALLGYKRHKIGCHFCSPFLRFSKRHSVQRLRREVSLLCCSTKRERERDQRQPHNSIMDHTRQMLLR